MTSSDNNVTTITPSPFNMKWSKLISSKRLGLEEYHDPRQHNRSDFQRDYDRMIFSSPFRRLQNKTQVFPLPGSIFVHNRLTHSLEVSSVGRSLGNIVADALSRKYADDAEVCRMFTHLPDIVATACICHDLGNPPFGHSGEKAIGTFFSEGEGKTLKGALSEQEWNDLIHFEGNANSLRLLAHQFCGRRPGGFAMTYSALASIVKYPYSSRHAGTKGKFGFFITEATLYRRIADELGIPELEPDRFARHPLVYLVEAADDICYQIMDIEDAHKLKILSSDETISLLLRFFEKERREDMQRKMDNVSDPNERVAYLRSNVIGALVKECADTFLRLEEDLLRGDVHKCLIDNMANIILRDAYAACSDTAWAKIYRAPDVVDIELAGNTIITFLLHRLLDAVCNPDKYSSKLLLSKIPQQYNVSAPTLFGRIQSVLDHVSGMTDVYALDLYRKLNGLSLPAV